MTLSSVKWWRNNCCTDLPICGDAPSCIKIILSKHCLCWSCGIIKRLSISWYLSAFTEQVWGPAWGIISKKYGPMIKSAVKPHQTNSFWGWSGISWNAWCFISFNNCSRNTCDRILRYWFPSSIRPSCERTCFFSNILTIALTALIDRGPLRKFIRLLNFEEWPLHWID